MSEIERILDFVEGAKTALDTMDSTGGGKHDRSEFWRGYRHALDSIGNQIDEVHAKCAKAAL